VGVGAGNKETMMAQLAQIFGAQMQLMPLGVSNAETIHATVIEMAKLSGFANPDKFWVDPRQHPPPPPPPNPEIIKIQADQQKTQATLQAEAEKFQAEAELERQRIVAQGIENEKNRQSDLEKARMSEATKLAIAEMNRSTTMETTAASQNFEAQKLGATFQREDQKAQQEQSKTQEKDDGMSELLNNLQGAIKSLAEGMNRPKSVIRGPDGKIAGVQ
jgi:hypothetical protein